jgi:hypothetical protein
MNKTQTNILDAILTPKFELPSLNIQRNNTQLSAYYHVLRLFIEHTAPTVSGFSPSDLFSLIFKMETMYKQSILDFCINSKSFSNWLKVSYLTGDYSIRDLQPSLYSPVHGCPFILVDIVSLLRSDKIDVSTKHHTFRIAYSALLAYKVLVVPTAPSFHTITAKSNCTINSILSIQIPRALEMLSINTKDSARSLSSFVNTSKWHFSNASGPNGNAVWSAHLDAYALSKDTTVLANLDKFCKAVKMDHVITALNHCKYPADQLPNFDSSKLITSKLHYIFTQGTKCRIVAISDYFTQEALSPLHDSLASIVKNIPMDATFDQDAGFERIKKLSMYKGAMLYSYDLSSATDRLPAELQSRIISALYGDDIGPLWKNLITQRTWHDSQGNAIKYEVGQPMGTKTSFPMLALTHHVIVQHAAALAGQPKFDRYVILGDDIVIADQLVAQQYLKIMDALDLTINMNKSITPGIISNSAEFASRLVMNGIELSHLPPNLSARAFINGEYAAELQSELFKRDLLTDTSTWTFFASFLNDKELLSLVQQNGLPETVTGLKPRVPLPDAPDLNYTSWESTYGITKSDIEEFLTYTIVQDQLSKLDRLLQSSNNTLSAMMQWVTTSGYVPMSVANGEITLEDFIKDIMIKSDTTFFHPIQEIARSESNRISEILTKFIMAPSHMREFLRKGLVDSIRIQLDQNNIRRTSQPPQFAPVYKRLLDKALRLLLKTRETDSKSVSNSLKLQAIDQIWNLSVGLGRPFTVSPLITKVSFNSSISDARLRTVTKGITLSQALSQKTPETRRIFHPKGRLQASE